MSITPLQPQAPATPPSGWEAGARDGAGGGGSGSGSFEDFLAAMLRDAEDFLGRDCGAAPPRPACPPHVAELFNEAGFFGAAVSPRCEPAGQPGPGADAQLAHADVPTAAATGAAASARPDPGGALPTIVSYGRAAVAGRSVRTPAQGNGAGSGAAAGPARRPAPAAMPAQASRAQPQPDEPAAPAARRAGTPQRPTPRSGAALDIQLSLQAAGAEASLAARVQALSREERERLRLEIVQLLARHGFGARSISLNGESGRLGAP